MVNELELVKKDALVSTIPIGKRWRGLGYSLSDQQRKDLIDSIMQDAKGYSLSDQQRKDLIDSIMQDANEKMKEMTPDGQ